MIFSPFTTTISGSSALVRFEVRRRRWLLPPFVRTRTPDPVRRNRLEVALWVFNFTLPAFCLRGTALLLSKKFCGLLLRRPTYRPAEKRLLLAHSPTGLTHGLGNEQRRCRR